MEDDRQLIISIEGALRRTYGFYLDQVFIGAANFVKGAPRDAQIRQGHMILADTIKGKLKDAVSASRDNGIRSIVVTGHSQGGSVAEILAASYQADYPSLKVSVLAFNPPKSGNLAWAKHIEALMPGSQVSYAAYKNDGTVHDPGGEYTHPAGEIFLPVGAKDPDGWVECKGRQNKACSTGVTENLESAGDGSP